MLEGEIEHRRSKRHVQKQFEKQWKDNDLTLARKAKLVTERVPLGPCIGNCGEETTPKKEAKHCAGCFGWICAVCDGKERSELFWWCQACSVEWAVNLNLGRDREVDKQAELEETSNLGKALMERKIAVGVSLGYVEHGIVKPGSVISLPTEQIEWMKLIVFESNRA